MNEIPEELRLYRGQLRDAIERDLHRRPLRSRAPHRRASILIPTVAVLAAATAAAVLLGLTPGATSPPSAYAQARLAIVASSSGSVDSGTMTMTFGIGDHTTLRTTQWNGEDVSISGSHGSLGGPGQVLLIGGSVYAQQADGTWLRYASEADAGMLARDLERVQVDVAGTSAAQILALVPGLQATVQPDGSTVFTGTIPASDGAEVTPSDDTVTRLGAELPILGRVAELKLVVGSDGLVRQMSETADDGSASWTVQYSQLGSTPPITPPASFTDATTAPTPPTPTETTAP